jgi:23S rRNA (guanosine2251-2'-O)-methyltransferase
MYVYGKNVAKEMIDTNKEIKRAILYKNFSDTKIINSLKRLNVPIKYLEKKEMNNIVDGMHQGIILDVPDFDYADIDTIINDDDSLVVILDHISDPHNFGAIIRTCEAAGVTGIIIPKDRSITVNSTVIKVSTGAINNMPIVKVTNLATTIDKLKDIGYWIVGTDMDGEDYTSIDYNMPICLIIGNEGHGMSKIVSDNCDFIAKIPMVGKINSLNASVSCGIILSRIVSGDR